ncbi:unnamed protein product [Hymenolepis diminuta]|uniref:Reverse transcriptase domain-containing protein n=1 Tax=Hymenolepis diminuta TaxID=6216 RepID=A0A564YV85_HYMDI|nr:unnamed protein product [Hymenolepis diminuta]
MLRNGSTWLRSSCSRSVGPTEAAEADDLFHFRKISVTRVTESKTSSRKMNMTTCLDADLYIKENAKPVFHPNRQVPFSAIQSVEEKLSSLKRIDVLQLVSYSKWTAPIAVERKRNGSVRLCVDYSTGLNTALKDDHHLLSVAEDVSLTLNGGTCFAKFNFSDAYLQVEVKREYI